MAKKSARRAAFMRASTMLTWAAGITSVVTLGSPALAQNTEEEIIVTATQRATTLQNVPLAITAVTSEQVQNSGIRDIQDLTSVAPSLQFNVSESEASATARLRGVGTQGSNPGLESAVGIFVDGVYRARNGVALSDLGEVGQIEVLRGPQGTLFGRNTSAGLITIATRAPDLQHYEVNLEAGAGNYGSMRVAGSANFPLAEDVAAFRIFMASDKREGFMDMNVGGANPLLPPSGANLGPHEDNTRGMVTIRPQFLMALGDDMEIRVIADYTSRSETCCAAQVYNPVLLNGNPTTILLGPPSPAGVEGPALQFGAGRTQLTANLGGYGGNVTASNPRGALGAGEFSQREGFANRSNEQDIEDKGVSAEFTWDINDTMTLTSITAWRDWVLQRSSDSDYSQADLTYVPYGPGNRTQFTDFTQEFRLAGQSGNLDWLFGAFFSSEQIDQRFEFRVGAQYGAYFASLDSVVVGVPPTPGLGVPVAGGGAAAGLYNALALVPAGSGYADHHQQDGRSLAFFTHNIYAITPSTDLTVGLRYTTERKQLTSSFNTSFSGQALFAATVAGVEAGNGLPAGSLAPLATCNTSVQAPASLATAFSLLRSGFCLPWLRTNLDAVGYDQDRGDHQWSGVVSLRQELTDDISGYVSFSRGYKGGGFNLDRDFGFVVVGGRPNSAFEEELVDAYEVGLKTGWFDNRLLLNFAVYHNQYENFQLNTFNGVQFVVTTVPEVTSEGAEVDMIWRTPIDGLSFQGGLAYTDATYGEDTGWVNSNRNPITGEPTLARLPNSQLTNAPEWTETLSVTYETPLFNGAMTGLAYLDVRNVDEQNTGSDLRPSKVQPAYTLLNGRLGLSTSDERWSVEVWGRNLTDEEYAQIMFDTPLQLGTNGPTQSAFLGDPRTYGATIRFHY